MSQKRKRRPPLEEAKNVRIREPNVLNPESARHVSFVAFTSTEALQCHLVFDYGSSMPTEATCSLKLPIKPTSYEVYDLFNKLFKPVGRQTQALFESSRSGNLQAAWTLNKRDFKRLTQEVKEELGEEWSKIFFTVSNNIGKDAPSLGTRVN
jgi:hypothetical protein